MTQRVCTLLTGICLEASERLNIALHLKKYFYREINPEKKCYDH